HPPPDRPRPRPGQGADRRVPRTRTARVVKPAVTRNTGGQPMEAPLFLALYLVAFLAVWLGVAVTIGVCWCMVWLASRIPGRLGAYLRDDQHHQAATMIVWMLLFLGFWMSLWSGVFARTPQMPAETPQAPNGVG